MKSVMNYFEEIMNIPRESGKEEKIAQYIIDYAKENGIEYYLGKCFWGHLPKTGIQDYRGDHWSPVINTTYRDVNS